MNLSDFTDDEISVMLDALDDAESPINADSWMIGREQIATSAYSKLDRYRFEREDA